MQKGIWREEWFVHLSTKKTLNDDGRRRLRPLYGDGFGMIAIQTEKWMIVQL